MRIRLSPKGFYVYAYLRDAETNNGTAGSPYYIGKGFRRRAWHKRHRVPPPKNPECISILIEGLDESSAFVEEQRLIKLYGRINNGTGCLHNLREGGFGPLNLEETQKVRSARALEAKKRKISSDKVERLHKGYRSWLDSLSPEERAARSEVCRVGRLNKTHTEEAKKRMSEIKQKAAAANRQKKVDNFLDAFYSRIRLK